MAIKPNVAFDDFLKLDLRVGTVLACEPHPNADRLLKIQVDLGDEGQRQICAGIRQYYDPDQLVGKRIVVAANLEPRTIRGEESNGMMLAASKTEGEDVTDVRILTVDGEVPNGAMVS